MKEFEQQLATDAIKLYTEISELQSQLDSKKNGLREIANGNKKEIEVEGLGKVLISSPREGSEKQVLVFNEERLKEIPELKAKLISTGVAKEETQKVPPAQASVTIKPNV